MREINHNARLKGVNQKFKQRQSETFVRGRTKVFKKAGSVRKRFLSPSSPPPYFSFLPSPYFSRGQKPENSLLARWKRLLSRLVTRDFMLIFYLQWDCRMFVYHVYESLIDPRLYKLIIVVSRFRELWPLAVVFSSIASWLKDKYVLRADLYLHCFVD